MKNLKKEVSYFDILGISENSTKEEIKKTYKELAKQYHPDKFKDVNEKKVAEKHFNVIKKAYDEIIKEFETNDSQIMMDQIYQSVDFIKFFSQFSSEQISESNHNNKQKSNKRVQEAINFMESKINDFNINWVFVYECIRKEKMFILWEVDNLELNNIMTNEVIFRNHISEGSLYKCFSKNRNLFFNPDINITILIKPNIAQKKFEHKISYYQYSVCNNCEGAGCNQCNTGIKQTKVNKTLKFSLINNGEIYKIKNGGFKSNIVTGDLVIKFKYSNAIANDFEIKQFKKQKTINIEPIQKTITASSIYLRRLINNIIYYKTHSIYISIILLLIVVIILLAVLL